jgi:branched-chain amino acid transport system ATP-binding protein
LGCRQEVGRVSRLDRDGPIPLVASFAILPALEARGISKSYGAVNAVADVTLRVDAKVIYGIIGPNGAGKSTLFKLLAGFERPDAGTITFESGQRIERMAGYEHARLGIVRTFQELEVFPELSAGEILTTAALMRHPLRDARERALEVAADLEIPWRALPAELGPGALRRIELARCILMQPRVVLFDEVMAGLTMSEAQFMMQRIARLHETGVAVVIVEHVMHVVRSLCRHIFVMASGNLIAEGSPEEIGRDDAVVAAYLGTRAGQSLA